MAEKKSKPKPKPPRPRRLPLIEQLHEVEIRPAFRGRDAEIKTMTVGEHVCWLISEFGVGVETAADVCEISQRVVFNWQARGLEWIEENLPAEGDDGPEEIEVPAKELPYVRFVQGLKKARGEAEIFHLKNVKLHSRVSWQASAWYLERVKPERYGRRSRHEHTGPEGGPIRHEAFVVPEEEREEWEKRVTQVAAEAVADRERARSQG